MHSNDMMNFRKYLMEQASMPLLLVHMDDRTVLAGNHAFVVWCGGLEPGLPLREVVHQDAARRLEEQWNALLEEGDGAGEAFAGADLADGDDVSGLHVGAPWLEGTLMLHGARTAKMRVLHADPATRHAVAAVLPKESWFMRLAGIAHLDAVLMNFPGTIAFKDSTGRFLACNRALEVISGRSSEELCGHYAPEFMPPSTAWQYMALDEQARRERRGVVADVEWGSGDDALWIRTACEPVYNRSGDLLGFFYLGTDVSERYAMEAALSMRDSLLQAVSRAAQVLLTGSSDFDAVANEVLGMLGRALEADRVYVWSIYPDAEHGGSLYATQIYEWSPGAQPQQGTALAVHRPLEDLAPSWLTRFRAGRCVNGLVREMSEAEQEQLDGQGIRSLLAAPITIDGNLWGFIGFDDCHVERHWSAPEENILLAAGNLIGMAIESHAMREELVAANRSLSLAARQANELAAEANRANRIKTEFLANMSHEIRTPMNAIMGLTYLALEEEPDVLVRGYLSKIDGATRGLLQIIDDILDVSKVEAGRMDLEHVRFSLGDILDGVMDIMQPKAVEAGLSLSVDVAPDVPDRLVGDPLRFKQILTNLVNNAVKFTKKGGVRIGVALDTPDARERREAVLRVSVMDTGIGIRPEDVDGIFQAFRQADTSTTRRYGGTGLGLTICASLVKLMHGEIHCESEPGKGSTFWFTVRLERGDRAEAAGSGAPRAFAADDPLSGEGDPALCGQDDAGCWRKFLAGRRVLVAEDNDINQLILTSLLERAGMQVTMAGNGREALEKLEKAPFDAVLMDIQMPEMDGLTAAARIRADTRFARLPILAMTAHAMPADREKSLRAGMDGHITKPVDPPLLYRELVRRLTPGAADRTDAPGPAAPTRG